jgi:transcription factor IIIB 90 kDa subunit
MMVMTNDNHFNNARLSEHAGEQEEQQHQQQQQQQHDMMAQQAPPLHPQPPPLLQMGFATAHHSSSSLMCPNCGGRDIEQQDASGASVCTKCGVVVEENAIVSSVEFVEGAGGASSMVGQFVSATSSKAYSRSGGGGGGSGGAGGGGAGGVRGGAGRFGFSRDSRETTLANGRRKIQEVASRLRLGSMFVDAAHRLYSIAIERNFVQGRRTTHVIAACLYIACRQEKSQHMLIDFSDALQVNVYTLGTCFLKFRRLLGLKLAVIDPALYVYRFAAHLDLDEKANAVALTALRLVARMKRDWIVSGRRPAGICAAALLIAARAHGFSRQHSDVTRILKVCGLTVTTRVREFEQTSSARLLSLEQFQKVDLETEGAFMHMQCTSLYRLLCYFTLSST